MLSWSKLPPLLQNDFCAPPPPPSPAFLAPCYLTIQLYPHCLLWYSQDTSGMLLPDCICLFRFLWFAWVFLQIFARPITLFLQKIFNQTTISQKLIFGHYSKLKAPLYFISLLITYYYLICSILNYLSYLLPVSSPHSYAHKLQRGNSLLFYMVSSVLLESSSINTQINIYWLTKWKYKQ